MGAKYGVMSLSHVVKLRTYFQEGCAPVAKCKVFPSGKRGAGVYSEKGQNTPLNPLLLEGKII
jgi:hypothetical protein